MSEKLRGARAMKSSSTLAMQWAVAEGIISSTSGTERLLSPQRNASRAEVATILMQFQSLFP